MAFWNRPTTSEQAEQQLEWTQSEMDRLGEQGRINSQEMKHLTEQHKQQYQTREQLRKQEREQ